MYSTIGMKVKPVVDRSVSAFRFMVGYTFALMLVAYLSSASAQVTITPAVAIEDYVVAFGTALGVVVTAVIGVAFGYLVIRKGWKWGKSAA